MTRKVLTMVKLTVLILCALSLVGCGATGSTFVKRDIEQDKAVVYIYRKTSFVGAAQNPYFFANNKPITRIDNGGYFAFLVDPGTIEFKVLQRINLILIGGAILTRVLNEEFPVYSFEALPGKEYFFVFKVGVGYAMKPVPQEKALETLKKMRMFEDLQIDEAQI